MTGAEGVVAFARIGDPRATDASRSIIAGIETDRAKSPDIGAPLAHPADDGPSGAQRGPDRTAAPPPIAEPPRCPPQR
ncbi:MAG: hypothetical protein ABR970_03040 [Roseiarcus sp.]|jgi:tryptophan synthase alpha subunit